jgi:hypothetical protein
MKLQRLHAIFLIGLILNLFQISVAKGDSKIENWIQINQTLKLNDSFSLFTEVQPRISYSEGELASMIARLAPVFNINSHHQVGAGFLWQGNFSPSASNETRLFLQYIANYSLFEKSSFIHRFRFEHRALSTTLDKAYRLRYQLRTLHSWFSDSNLRFLLSDEVFFNLNTTALAGPVSGFDQNRLVVGINYIWAKNLNSDIGYMYNHIKKPRSVENRDNHIFYYCLNANF